MLKVVSFFINTFRLHAIVIYIGTLFITLNILQAQITTLNISDLKSFTKPNSKNQLDQGDFGINEMVLIGIRRATPFNYYCNEEDECISPHISTLEPVPIFCNDVTEIELIGVMIGSSPQIFPAETIKIAFSKANNLPKETLCDEYKVTPAFVAKYIKMYQPSIFKTSLFKSEILNYNLTDYSNIMITPFKAVIDIHIPHSEKSSIKSNESIYSLCIKKRPFSRQSSLINQASPKTNKAFNDYIRDGVWVFTDSFPSFQVMLLKARSRYILPYMSLQIILILVMFFISGLFSGLTIGLLSLDPTELMLIQKSGNPDERRYAKLIAPLRRRGNFLLCTLVLGNVLVNSTLTVLLENLSSGKIAVIVSTLGITIFGEILPQAICTRHGLAIGARTIWLTKAVMVLTAPLSYPISILLDHVLGEEIGSVYDRQRLIELVKMMATGRSDYRKNMSTVSSANNNNNNNLASSQSNQSLDSNTNGNNILIKNINDNINRDEVAEVTNNSPPIPGMVNGHVIQDIQPALEGQQGADETHTVISNNSRFSSPDSHTPFLSLRRLTKRTPFKDFFVKNKSAFEPCVVPLSTVTKDVESAKPYAQNESQIAVISGQSIDPNNVHLAKSLPPSKNLTDLTTKGVASGGVGQSPVNTKGSDQTSSMSTKFMKRMKDQNNQKHIKFSSPHTSSSSSSATNATATHHHAAASTKKQRKKSKNLTVNSKSERHKSEGDLVTLRKDEADIITGALFMCTKTVGEIMTPLKSIFAIGYQSILDFETMASIVSSGYTRIPIFQEPDRSHIVGLLNFKDLAFIDPDDRVPLSTILKFYNHSVTYVFEDTLLSSILEEFKKGKSHMAFVRRVIEEDDKDPSYKIVGLVTLEDVIEEIIQSEIWDETDNFDRMDNKGRHIRKRNNTRDFTLFWRPNSPQKCASSVLSPQMALVAYQYLKANIEAFKDDLVSATVLRKLMRRPSVIINEPFIHSASADRTQELVPTDGPPIQPLPRNKLQGILKNKEQSLDDQEVLKIVGNAFNSNENFINVTNTSNALYIKGKPADYFILILEGRVRVYAGTENICFETGPFSYFGLKALTAPEIGLKSSQKLSNTSSQNPIQLSPGHFIPDFTVIPIYCCNLTSAAQYGGSTDIFSSVQPHAALPLECAKPDHAKLIYLKIRADHYRAVLKATEIERRIQQQDDNNGPASKPSVSALSSNKGQEKVEEPSFNVSLQTQDNFDNSPNHLLIVPSTSKDIPVGPLLNGFPDIPEIRIDSKNNETFRPSSRISELSNEQIVKDFLTITPRDSPTHSLRGSFK